MAEQSLKTLELFTFKGDSQMEFLSLTEHITFECKMEELIVKTKMRTSLQENRFYYGFDVDV